MRMSTALTRVRRGAQIRLPLCATTIIIIITISINVRWRVKVLPTSLAKNSVLPASLQAEQPHVHKQYTGFKRSLSLYICINDFYIEM